MGSICHAGSVLISAGILCGRRTIGTLGLKDDLVSAGATYVDKRAFRDGNIVWGRVVLTFRLTAAKLWPLSVNENPVKSRAEGAILRGLEGESRQDTGLTYIKRVTARLGR